MFSSLYQSNFQDACFSKLSYRDFNYHLSQFKFIQIHSDLFHKNPKKLLTGPSSSDDNFFTLPTSVLKRMLNVYP